jgi:hypothetical protein
MWMWSNGNSFSTADQVTSQQETWWFRAMGGGDARHPAAR